MMMDAFFILACDNLVLIFFERYQQKNTNTGSVDSNLIIHLYKSSL